MHSLIIGCAPGGDLESAVEFLQSHRPAGGSDFVQVLSNIVDKTLPSSRSPPRGATRIFIYSDFDVDIACYKEVFKKIIDKPEEFRLVIHRLGHVDRGRRFLKEVIGKSETVLVFDKEEPKGRGIKRPLEEPSKDQ